MAQCCQVLLAQILPARQFSTTALALPMAATPVCLTAGTATVTTTLITQVDDAVSIGTVVLVSTISIATASAPVR